MLPAKVFLKHDIAIPNKKPLGAWKIPYTIGEKLMATEMLKHGEPQNPGNAEKMKNCYILGAVSIMQPMVSGCWKKFLLASTAAGAATGRG